VHEAEDRAVRADPEREREIATSEKPGDLISERRA
jgi:hypothetical protein